MRTLGIWDEATLIIDELKANPPDVVFNLTEHFNEVSAYDRNVAGLLDVFDGGTYRLDGQDVAGLPDRQRSALRNEKLGFKIREAELAKVPFLLVVGGKERESRSVSLRWHKRGDQGQMALDRAISLMLEAAALPPAAVRPALITMMGFTRATSRATERKARASPMDSM